MRTAQVHPAEIIQEFWDKVAQIGWGTKTTDYGTIKRDLLKAWTPEKAEKMSDVFGMLSNALYVKCDKVVDGVGDDSFGDLRAHIIGLGREEFNRVMENPKLAQERINKGDYKESFSYCLPYASDYALLDPAKYVERAHYIVSALKEGLGDDRFEPVFPKMKELMNVFAPALEGQVLLILSLEKNALALQKAISKRADWLWRDQCRSGGHFACSAAVANFFNDARRYLEP